MSEGYNGWKNYETWCVNLWIDNEEGLQGYWRENARCFVEEASEHENVKIGIWQEDRCAVYLLAERLRDEIEGDAPEVYGMYADLLSAAISEVYWHEIAEAMIEGLSE